LASWAAAAAVWRMSSLAALITALLVPLYMLAFRRPLFAVLELLLALFVLVMHRDNISRILNGREPRIGTGSKAAET
jgi:acyl phosphate:glycerol-3-phosphate acyltransferase